MYQTVHSQCGVPRLQSFSNSYNAHSEHSPGECRVASSMEQEQHRTMGTTAVNSENVQWSQGNTYVTKSKQMLPKGEPTLII